MAKFPSQRKMLYQTGALSNDTYTIPTSGGVSGALNLPKDLSLLNRRGYASTTRKGVPLVYRAKIDFYPQDEDGQGPGSAMGSDFQATLKIDGCQNNWVMRNAAVKFHAAREAMFRKAGVTKKERGAYAHEIRYNYDGNTDTWLVPIDGNGDAFTGGTWDQSVMSIEDDVGFSLKLTGTAVNENGEYSGSVQQIGYSYLVSRSTVPDDSNLESSQVAADHSILKELLNNNPQPDSDDEIRDEAQGQGDNPPYDLIVASDTDHDITESVELGRAICGTGYGYGSVIVDIPFGIAGLKATVYNAADTNITPSLLIGVEVLDIFEMQG